LMSLSRHHGRQAPRILSVLRRGHPIIGVGDAGIGGGCVRGPSADMTDTTLLHGRGCQQPIHA
jgi:hypothetical protein